MIIFQLKNIKLKKTALIKVLEGTYSCDIQKKILGAAVIPVILCSKPAWNGSNFSCVGEGQISFF